MDLMCETRWLTDSEQRVWRDFSAAFGMMREHIDRQLQNEAGIPHTYYEVLVALSEAPNRTMRMSELALACRSSRSRLSHAIARLETSGWVQRSSCPEDKRGSFAQLTPVGFAALEAAAPGHVGAVREALFDALTPAQVAALGEISAAVSARLAPRCTAIAAAGEEPGNAAAEPLGELR